MPGVITEGREPHAGRLVSSGQLRYSRDGGGPRAVTERKGGGTSTLVIVRIVSHLVVCLYLATLALLPWSWFPPFPWLHVHAQWSDVLFLATAVLWVIEQSMQGRLFQFRPFHAALLVYLAAASLSWLGASADSRMAAWKLLGIAELCSLAWLSSDLAARPGVARLATRVIAVSFLLSAAAALAGFGLFLAGVETRLVGTYGEHLAPSRRYVRVQAGSYHPNLLVSYCTFVAAVLSFHRKAIPFGLWGLLQTVALDHRFSHRFLRYPGICAGGLPAVGLHVRRTLVGRLLHCRLPGGNTRFHCLESRGRSGRPVPFPREPRSAFGAPASDHLLIPHAGRPSGFWHGPGHLARGTPRSPVQVHLTLLNIAATLGLPALFAFTFLIVILCAAAGIRATNLSGVGWLGSPWIH